MFDGIRNQMDKSNGKQQRSDSESKRTNGKADAIPDRVKMILRQMGKLDDLLTIPEVAEYCRVTRPVVDQWIKEGELEIIKISAKKYLVLKESLARLLSKIDKSWEKAREAA